MSKNLSSPKSKELSSWFITSRMTYISYELRDLTNSGLSKAFKALHDVAEWSEERADKMEYSLSPKLLTKEDWFEELWELTEMTERILSWSSLYPCRLFMIKIALWLNSWGANCWIKSMKWLHFRLRELSLFSLIDSRKRTWVTLKMTFRSVATPIFVKSSLYRIGSIFTYSTELIVIKHARAETSYF